MLKGEVGFGRIESCQNLQMTHFPLLSSAERQKTFNFEYTGLKYRSLYEKTKRKFSNHLKGSNLLHASYLFYCKPHENTEESHDFRFHVLNYAW